jgi:hypothetical protein
MYIPGMIMIGGTARYVGKTTCACAVIDRFKDTGDITAIKTTIFDATSLEYDPYWGPVTYTDPESRVFLTEDMNAPPGKDTGRLRDAGAKRVLWLHTVDAELEYSARILSDIIGSSTVSVCESTGLRAVVEPDLFIMLQAKNTQQIKQSARTVMHYADIITGNTSETFTDVVEALELVNGRWRKRGKTP